MKTDLFEKILLLTHAYMTCMMVGIVFFVQAVYLPLYRRFKTHLSEYEKKDLIHMGYLVGPIHLIEWISAIILLFTFKDNYLYRLFAFINVGLLVLIFLVNWLIRMKKQQKDLLFIHKMHNVLLTSNWFRTVCWSLRGWTVIMMILFSYVKF